MDSSNTRHLASEALRRGLPEVLTCWRAGVCTRVLAGRLEMDSYLTFEALLSAVSCWRAPARAGAC